MLLAMLRPSSSSPSEILLPKVVSAPQDVETSPVPQTPMMSPGAQDFEASGGGGGLQADREFWSTFKLLQALCLLSSQLLLQLVLR
jgi:hypothetical protein